MDQDHAITTISDEAVILRMGPIFRNFTPARDIGADRMTRGIYR